jgi:general secretion pathway protein B
MSYILDALKKAERERDAAQIPNLTTVHDTPAVRSFKLYWIVIGTMIVCAALFVGIGFLLLRPSTSPDASKTRISGAAKEVGAAPVLDRRGETLPDLVTPRTIAEPKVQPAISSSVGVVADAKHSPPSLQDQKEPDSIPPVTKEPVRPQVPSKAPSTESMESPPVAAAPPSRPSSLNEAVAKMNMNILFYSGTKSERMVFIDGRRYSEGDYIDGFYLIESITPEGAWLSYQGSRAILRPKAK